MSIGNKGKMKGVDGMDVDEDPSEENKEMEVEEENLSRDSDEGEDIVLSSGELVQECEEHLRDLEKELETAETNRKELLVLDKVHSAQR